MYANYFKIQQQPTQVPHAHQQPLPSFNNKDAFNNNNFTGCQIFYAASQAIIIDENGTTYEFDSQQINREKDNFERATLNNFEIPTSCFNNNPTLQRANVKNSTIRIDSTCPLNTYQTNFSHCDFVSADERYNRLTITGESSSLIDCTFYIPIIDIELAGEASRVSNCNFARCISRKIKTNLIEETDTATM